MNLAKDSVGTTIDRRFTNARMNLIYLTDFSARNERQQLSYERMMLLSIRASVKMVRMYRQLKPNVVRTIQQLKIQKRRRRGKKGGQAKTDNVKILSTRFINFSNLRIVTTIKGSQVANTDKCWTKFGFGNIQSLKNKDNLLRDYLNREDIGVFLAIETWYKSDDESMLRIQGSVLNTDNYKIAVANRESGLRGGGLALVHKDTLDSKLIDKGQLHTFEYAHWSVIGPKMALSLLAVYHPPPSANHKHTINEFITEFVNFLADKLVNFVGDLIIAGDFNIHVNDVENADARQFLGAMEALGFDQLVDFCTHKSGNILDLMFTCIGNKIKCGNIKSDGFVSDHCLIQSKLDLAQNSCSSVHKITRKFRGVEFETFWNDAGLEDMSKPVEDCENVNLEEFLNTCNVKITQSLDKHAPFRKSKKKVRPRKMWFSEELQVQRSIVRNRERLWRKYLYNHLWVAFKIERNRYNGMLKKAKEVFISQDILSHKNDIKYLYKVITNLSGVRKENPMPQAESDQQLAEEFADFFIGKIDKIQEELDHFELYKPTTKDQVVSKQSFLPTTTSDVKNLVMKMKSKTNELDLLPVTFIKENIEKFADLLANIVNISLQSGIFANEWKTALLYPLIKKTGLDVIKSNYRPISNLSFISRLVEKAAINQLVQHADHHDLTPHHQAAYKKNHSCETSLLRLTNDALWAMEQQQATILVVTDLSAAFDTVNHDILLSVLEKRFGIQGNILHWVETYLRPRNFKVCIGDCKSGVRELKQSVPQGSVGGPILFNFYCSTITSTIDEESGIELGAFADDHNIRKKFTPTIPGKEKEALQIMELSLDRIIEWMNKNRLKINPTKTELMYIASRRQIKKCSENTIRVGEDRINRTAEVKLLGVWLDEHLSYEQHILKKCKSAMLSIYKIRNLRSYLSQEACQVLIHSLVFSHLDYCNSLLFGLPECVICKIQRVQNIAAKLVLNLGKSESPRLAMFRLHWLPIRYRLDFKIALLMYKCYKGEAPKYLSDLLDIEQRTESSRRLRSHQANNVLYRIPFTRAKTFADRSFSVAGPKIWNGLPTDVQHSETVDSFKTKLKTFLFRKCYSDLL